MVWYMSYQISVLVREVSTIQEALSLISAKHEIVDKPDAKPLVVNKGSIRFQDVIFSYDKKPPIFNHLTVAIPAGQKNRLSGFFRFRKIYFCELNIALV